MKFLFAVMGLALSANAATPRLANERLVVRTIAGDMVMALYPDVAPKHVAQILKLARLGVYDGTHFFRLEPSFVLQIGNAQDRLVPLTAEQAASVTKLPLEVSADLKHAAGSLSMARWDEDENSAETSFSILLNFAPHLDGKYTIFGHLESGVETLLELVRTPRDKNNRPRTRLAIERIEVADSIADLAKMNVAPARALAHAEIAQEPTLLPSALVWGLALLVVLSLAFAHYGRRLPLERAGSLHLLIALVAAFLFVIALLPLLPASRWLGILLFVGLVVLFRSLGRFESV